MKAEANVFGVGNFQLHFLFARLNFWLSDEFMLLRSFTIIAVTILMVGCKRWDSVPGHYVRDTNAMADVSLFIATNGWNSSTNDEDLYHWEDLPPHYLHDLPWSKLRNQQIQTLTHGGILYVLSNPG